MWWTRSTKGFWQKVRPPHRGLTFGDGLFETVRVLKGRPCFLADHQKRLAEGLEALSLRLPYPANEVWQAVKRLAKRFPESRIKIVITRLGEGAYAPPTNESCVWIQVKPLLPMPTYPLGPDQTLLVYPYPLSLYTPWSAYKTLSAVGYVQSSAYAQAQGFTDALLRTPQGTYSETARANFFLWDGHALFTPPLSEGIVKGVFRSNILKAAQNLGLPCFETPITKELLASAKAAFTTNVIQGLCPVTTISHQKTYHLAKAPIYTLLTETIQTLLG